MKKQPSSYSAAFYVWNGVSAFFFANSITPFHSHNTLQIVIDLRDIFKSRLQHGEWMWSNMLVIRQDAVHQLDTNNSVQLILYLDAASKDAKDIQKRWLNDQQIASIDSMPLDPAAYIEMERCLLSPNKESMEKIVRRVLLHLTGNQQMPLSDLRIARVLSLIGCDMEEPWTIKTLAEEICLSPSRLRYIFKASTGCSLHRYLIWSRIMIAITKLLHGSTELDAAIASGFSDTSHFHKMLVQMFGISPSQFIKENNRKRVFICHDDYTPIETRFHNSKSGEQESIWRMASEQG